MSKVPVTVHRLYREKNKVVFLLSDGTIYEKEDGESALEADILIDALATTILQTTNPTPGSAYSFNPTLEDVLRKDLKVCIQALKNIDVDMGEQIESKLISTTISIEAKKE